ncbi:MAG: ParA family protein [Chloroflexota bacterium]
MTKILAVAMQKGGVGKTTTTVSLAAGIAQLGQRVLAIDLDAQGNLTQHCGIDPEHVNPTVYDIFKAEMDGTRYDTMTAVYETDEGFHILPSQPELSLIELSLMNTLSRERVLSTILENIKPYYDYILIDCNPSLGLLVINALTTATGVLIPIQTEYLAARGASMIMSSIETVRTKKLNPSLQIEGILLTMADTRTTLTKDIHDAILQQYGNDIRIFEPIIRRSVRFAESAVAGESILSYAPDTQGAKAYQSIAKELVLGS